MSFDLFDLVTGFLPLGSDDIGSMGEAVNAYANSENFIPSLASGVFAGVGALGSAAAYEGGMGLAEEAAALGIGDLVSGSLASSGASSIPDWISNLVGSGGDLAKSALSSPLLSGLGSGVSSAYSARETNEAMQRMFNQGMDFNAQQAALNRDFQKDMSNTAWQRGVADMSAAGINPMLAVSKGGGVVPQWGGSVSSRGSVFA